MRRVATQRASFVALLVLVVWAVRSEAYQTYSENRDATNCQACHGDFRATGYISRHNETPWGTDLMSGHYNMINAECSACHQSSFFPVSIDTSAGGGGLSSTGCVGCHGREQDAGHDSVSGGRGAGLRQQHFRAGVTVCGGKDCHTDADPGNYVPVGENIAPVNYFTPDTAHPNKPTDPCNANGSESKFGTLGLDNDGNGLYDLADPACQAPPACVGNCKGSGTVTVDDIITMVNIALGNADVSSCSAGDANGDHRITVDEILKAVNNALNGCPG